MSLQSILLKIQEKGKIRNILPPVPVKPANVAVSVKSHLTTNRPVDPVVARLKAARKAEQEKKEQERREKKGLAPKKEVKRRTAPQASKSRAPSKSTPQAPASRRGSDKRVLPAIPPPPNSERKKMSFTELMKKASLIDQSKMSIEIKQKTKSPETAAPRKPVSREQGERGRVPKLDMAHSGGRSQPRPSQYNGRSGSNGSNSHLSNGSKSSNLHSGRARPENQHSERKAAEPRVRAPLPTRGPSAKLQAQLKGRAPAQRAPKHVESDESDNDSFIESDGDEEVADVGYDRDEIWSMFNRGRKRSYYDRYDDEDSDDMEATGAEIFEEELRSKSHAMREDMRELKEEQRLAALKLARKKGRRV